MNPFLTDENLKAFIQTLNIAEEQKKFLFDEVSKLNEQERMDLINTLKDVYALNEEKNQAVQKIKDNWKN